jgi:5-methylcytosine-specific restriction endonuclease McrA
LKAQAAKRRAGFRCQVCNGTSRLQAHHRHYLTLGNEKPEDITVLCAECHKLFSKNKRVR